MIILKNNSYTRSNNGFIAAFFVVFVPVFIGILALVVDLSKMYGNTSNVKSALDTATLAGISQLQVSPTDITTVKTTTLSYLNSNLSMTINGFSTLTLLSSGLTIQCGVYDYTTATWTYDESSSSVNSVKVTYSYSAPSVIAGYFMINNFTISSTSTAAKTLAGIAAQGSAYANPINAAALTSALAASNMVKLYASGAAQNSYFTEFSSSSATVGNVYNKLRFCYNGGGSAPPLVTIGDTYRYITSSFSVSLVYILEFISWIFGANTAKLIIPVVTASSPNLTVTGFVIGDITGYSADGSGWYSNLTIYPKYVDNSRYGLKVGPAPTVSGSTNQAALANAVTLVN